MTILVLLVCGIVIILGMTYALVMAIRSIVRTGTGTATFSKSARVMIVYSAFLIVGVALIWVAIHFAVVGGYLR